MEQHLVFISHSSKDKHIADAICHYLEADGIPCWIAPRDINTSDWAGSIMDGLRRSDVFVVIISENSIASGEVTKEVTEATHTCRYILPFKVDTKDLSDRLQYHLGPCHWLEAIDPPLEARIAELTERIHRLSEEDAVYMNRHQRRLMEKIVWPRSLFVGRETEIQTVADTLEQEHVLFLQGMGGIGKSEIAKSYAKLFRDRYDTIVFAGYTSSLLDLVIGEEIPIENLRRGSADSESPEAFFARKLNILKELSTERTLLIIDNFDVEWDEHLEDVINGPYHLLITTRCNHEDYPTLRIGQIRDFEEVRRIFTTHYGKALSPSDIPIVDEILRLVNCHTITVELIAKQMKASRRKPADMLTLLKDTGTNTRLREKIRRDGGESGLTSFDYIRRMFRLGNLTEEEQQVLRCMCMLPYTGMDIEKFAGCCALESYDEINSLLAKSWLILDEETDILSLHPVICDVVKAELMPTPETCAEYIRGLWKISKDCWFFTAEERNAIAPYVSFIQRTYPEPCRELWKQYSDFVNIAWMCGNFEFSQKSGHTLYEYTLKTFGPGTMETGEAATYLAGAYHNSGDDLSAEPYYKLGLEHRLSALPPDSKDLATSYSKLGRCAYKKHDFPTAMEYLNRSMEIFELGGNLHHSGDTVVEFERTYMEMGDYETALEYCRKSYDVFLSTYGKEVPNCAYSLVDMGICCSKLGRYDEAEEYLDRALKLNIEFNGDVSIQTVRTREAIADNTLLRGDRKLARAMYLQLEYDLERDFGSANPQVIQIRTKRIAAEEA